VVELKKEKGKREREREGSIPGSVSERKRERESTREKRHLSAPSSQLSEASLPVVAGMVGENCSTN